MTGGMEGLKGPHSCPVAKKASGQERWWQLLADLQLPDNFLYGCPQAPSGFKTKKNSEKNTRKPAGQTHEDPDHGQPHPFGSMLVGVANSMRPLSHYSYRTKSWHRAESSGPSFRGERLGMKNAGEAPISL